MRGLRSLLLVLAVLLASVGTGWAVAPSPVAEVTFPKLSPNGNMDFWKIPWHPGDKLTGSFSLKVNAPVRNLTVLPVTGGTSLDTTSRNTIPKQYIRFSLPDSTVPVDAGAQASTQIRTYDAGTYLFTFDIENIPAEDTYMVDIQAVGEVQDQGTFVPFVQKLPSLKLKPFSEPEMSIISGSDLTAQWVNLDAPFSWLTPLERLIDRSESAFVNHWNPNMTVSLTMPGRPHVDTTQTFDVTMTLDPVLDDKGNETSDVAFAIEILNRSKPAEGSDKHVTGVRKQTVAVLGNDTLLIHIGRRHDAPTDDAVTATRIPPGIYKSQLHIQTAWGTKYDLPVVIRVRDNSLFAGLALVVGILVSLLAGYWQTRQPLFQAQVRARRWQSYYDEQGLLISLVDRVAQRLNAAIVASDGSAATQTSSLLESCMRDLPLTLALDAALTELQGLAPESAFQMWSLATGAANVESGLERLKGFCATHPNPDVQKFGAAIATTVWHGQPRGPAPESATDDRPFSQRLREGLKSFASHVMARAGRIRLPSFWDAATMIVMFVLVNGALIAMQMSQSYYQNETFGSATDYMSLLLWGFAGDATRATLSDLAAKVIPGKGAKPASSGSTGA